MTMTKEPKDKLAHAKEQGQAQFDSIDLQHALENLIAAHRILLYGREPQIEFWEQAVSQTCKRIAEAQAKAGARKIVVESVGLKGARTIGDKRVSSLLDFSWPEPGNGRPHGLGGNSSG